MQNPQTPRKAVDDLKPSELNPTDSLDIFNITYDRVTPVFHAFASTIRLQIILLLAQRKHYVYELVDTLGSSQPLISQHLKVLKNAGIITSVRTGRQVQYELVTPDVTKLLDEALKLEKLLANT